ncbi:MAG TPA: hypothetical protein VGJ82_21690 [Thermoanaerobaculia bacterium]
MLAEFDDAPAARLAWADLPSNPEYHTGGVVRALCKRANGMCERDPRYALVLADAAVGIAAVLPDAAYPAAALHEWRGEAWKEQANALHQLGRFEEAWVALDHAEAEYRGLKHEGIGHVAVTYIRAVLLYEQERFDGAAELAERSAISALHLGSMDRFMRAQHMHGVILHGKGDVRGAIDRFRTVLQYGKTHNSKIWIARESLALGNCHLLLGALPEARDYLLGALRLFKELGLGAYVARTEFALARLLFDEGAQNDAILRGRKSIADLTTFGIFTDAAIASVYLAEMLSAVGRTREIRKLLNGVVQTFVKAGKVSSALMALAYLRDAAKADRVTHEVAEHVRRFIGRAEHQPELLFEPPPDSPV